MSGDETPGEPTALARDIERAVRKANAAVARVGDLGGRLAEVAGRLGEVEQMLSDLSQDVTKLVDAEQPVQSWMLADDPEATLAAIRDLDAWLTRVYLRYPNTRLSSCWAWHPAVVEELLILRHLHRDAYSGKSAGKAAEWHDRWLPGVRDRIRKDAGNCELSLHRPGQRQGQPPAVTPMVQHLDAVVDAWMTTVRPPTPTQSQLDDAHEYQQKIFNPPVA